MMTDKNIILASASPRRKELLANNGVDFEVLVSDADESIKEGTSPFDAVMLISKRKAEAVKNLIKDDSKIIIAADTVVALGNEIMGKPKDEADAFAMLKRLSNKAHSVFTGVTIIKNKAADTFFVESNAKVINILLSNALSRTFLPSGLTRTI